MAALQHSCVLRSSGHHVNVGFWPLVLNHNHIICWMHCYQMILMSVCWCSTVGQRVPVAVGAKRRSWVDVHKLEAPGGNWEPEHYEPRGRLISDIPDVTRCKSTLDKKGMKRWSSNDELPSISLLASRSLWLNPEEIKNWASNVSVFSKCNDVALKTVIRLSLMEPLKNYSWYLNVLYEQINRPAWAIQASTFTSLRKKKVVISSEGLGSPYYPFSHSSTVNDPDVSFNSLSSAHTWPPLTVPTLKHLHHPYPRLLITLFPNLTKTMLSAPLRMDDVFRICLHFSDISWCHAVIPLAAQESGSQCGCVTWCTAHAKF